MTSIRSLSFDSVRVHESRPRPTPPPAGRQFRDAMAQAAGRVLQGIEAASPLVPGGALVGLAARGARNSVTGGESGLGAGSSLSGGLGGASSSVGLSSGANETLELLALQREIGLEQQRYSALSNVLKARHETARSVIQNVR